jgi:hypothetical protein
MPIKLIYLNDIIISPKLAYAYKEFKDDVVRYKIYQPYNKKVKWLNNFVDGTLSGFSQLPEYGDLLFITSSLKDGMCLHDLGYNFIAPQAESHIINKKVFNDLKLRFKKIITFYDNDEAGIENAKRNKKLYEIDYIKTNSLLEKDISDYYKKYGKEKSLNLIKNEL